MVNPSLVGFRPVPLLTDDAIQAHFDADGRTKKICNTRVPRTNVTTPLKTSTFFSSQKASGVSDDDAFDKQNIPLSFLSSGWHVNLEEDNLYYLLVMNESSTSSGELNITKGNVLKAVSVLSQFAMMDGKSHFTQEEVDKYYPRSRNELGSFVRPSDDDIDACNAHEEAVSMYLEKEMPNVFRVLRKTSNGTGLLTGLGINGYDYYAVYPDIVPTMTTPVVGEPTDKDIYDCFRTIVPSVTKHDSRKKHNMNILHVLLQSAIVPQAEDDRESSDGETESDSNVVYTDDAQQENIDDAQQENIDDAQQENIDDVVEVTTSNRNSSKRKGRTPERYI